MLFALVCAGVAIACGIALTVWVLGRPDAFLLTAGDVELLPRVLDAAERFERRPSDEEMAELTRRRDLAPLFV